MPSNLVDLPAVHRVPAVARLDDTFASTTSMLVSISNATSLCARDHDLPGDGVLELEDASKHLGVLLCDGTCLFALLDHMLDRQLGARRAESSSSTSGTSFTMSSLIQLKGVARGVRTRSTGRQPLPNAQGRLARTLSNDGAQRSSPRSRRLWQYR